MSITIKTPIKMFKLGFTSLVILCSFFALSHLNCSLRAHSLETHNSQFLTNISFSPSIAQQKSDSENAEKFDLESIKSVLPSSAKPSQLSNHLKKRFQLLKKPRTSFLFFKTVRLKKYNSTKKDLELFHNFVNSLQNNEAHINGDELYNIYRGLWDKISWINDFNNFAPLTFDSTFKANQTFKTQSTYFRDQLSKIKTGK